MITTEAYQQFVDVNALSQQILDGLPVATDPGVEELDDASQRIQGLFHAGRVPRNTPSIDSDAYDSMNRPAVAVRSSATAEDLAELSFAGQQDTYLNVQGAEALRAAVVDCWTSLWKSRAIGYRTRNGFSHSDISLAL